MTVLVTGAAGFIGFHLSKALLKRGTPVIGLDNLNAYYDPMLKGARVEELKKAFESFYPESNQYDYTSMVNKQHFARINGWIEDALSKGAEVISLGQFDTTNENLITTKVLLNVNGRMEVMQKESVERQGAIIRLYGLQEVI